MINRDASRVQDSKMNKENVNVAHKHWKLSRSRIRLASIWLKSNAIVVVMRFTTQVQVHTSVNHALIII